MLNRQQCPRENFAASWEICIDSYKPAMVLLTPGGCGTTRDAPCSQLAQISAHIPVGTSGSVAEAGLLLLNRNMRMAMSSKTLFLELFFLLASQKMVLPHAKRKKEQYRYGTEIISGVVPPLLVQQPTQSSLCCHCHGERHLHQTEQE